MSKTLNLISKYYKLLHEQTPVEQPGGESPATQPVPEIQTQPINNRLDENEKYVIKILTNAFIFNPSLFDKVKQKYIFNKINEIKGMVNVPVSKIVDEVKKIIALDQSLKVESKTLDLLNKYIVLLEQPADATEPQSGSSDTAKAENPNSQNNVDSGDNNNLNLAEIFPLYKELIIKSLKHVPTEEELMIVKPVVNEFADTDPEKIVEAIQNILSQSLEDREVEDNLSNA